MGFRQAVGAIVLMTGLSGCFDAPPEVKERLAATRAQGADMDAALDGIEERLLGNQASVKLWTEMAWRHKRVSALACENAAGHVESIERFMAQQEKKTRRRTRVVHEVSSAAEPVSDSRRN